MRVLKKITNRYSIIPNEITYSPDISGPALGLIVYCIARDDKDDEIDASPRSLFNKKFGGRDKVYALCNELIEAGYFLRIYNTRKCTRMGHLPGETCYEVFNDYEECRQRAHELLDDPTVGYLTCSSKFGITKKIYAGRSKKDKSEENQCKSQNLRYPENQDATDIERERYPENQDPLFQDTYIYDIKDVNCSKVTTTATSGLERENEPTASKKPAAEAVVVFSSLQDIKMPQSQKVAISSQHTEEQVNQAVAALRASKSPVLVPAAFLKAALRDGYKENDLRSEKDKIIESLQEIYKKTHPNMHSRNDLSLKSRNCMYVFEPLTTTPIQVSVVQMTESEALQYLKIALSLERAHNSRLNAQKGS